MQLPRGLRSDLAAAGQGQTNQGETKQTEHGGLRDCEDAQLGSRCAQRLFSGLGQDTKTTGKNDGGFIDKPERDEIRRAARVGEKLERGLQRRR